MDTLVEIGKQVPALGVLVFLVVYFMGHMEKAQERTRRVLLHVARSNKEFARAINALAATIGAAHAESDRQSTSGKR